MKRKGSKLISLCTSIALAVCCFNAGNYTKVYADESDTKLVEESFGSESVPQRWYATDGTASIEDGSLKIQNRTATWGGTLSYSFCNVNFNPVLENEKIVKDSKYTFSAKVKLGENATDGKEMFVGSTIQGDGLPQYLEYKSVVAKKDSWTEISGEFTPTWEGDLKQLDIRFGVKKDVNCDFYIDDVTIQGQDLSQPIESKNILGNGDFEEEDVSPWYAVTGTPDKTTLSIYNDDAQSGKQCVKISGRSDNWNAVDQKITNQVENGKIYDFSCYVKLGEEYGDETRTVKVGTSSSSDGDVEKYDTMVDTTTQSAVANSKEWTKISTKIIVNYKTSLENLEVKVCEEGPKLADGNFGSYYVDNVVMKDTSGQTASIEKDIPDLKNIFNDGTRVGAALPAKQYENDVKMDLVKKHFNSITLENEMKPSYFMGDKSPVDKDGNVDNTRVDKDGNLILNFDSADPFMDYMVQYNKENPDNQIKLRGHVLVWHNQTPDWYFKEGYRDNGALVDKQEMKKRMDNYIHDVLDHFTSSTSKYKDLFYAWDVVNEAIEIKDEKEDGLRNSNYYKIYGGNEYIIDAYRIANKYAPENLKLYYNDYEETNIEKKEDIIKLIEDIKSADGTRLDGMGMQAHYKMETPTAEEFGKAIREYSAHVDEVQITELDLEASGDYDGNKSIEYTKQAYRYKSLFDEIRKCKKDGVNITAVTFWGTTDDSSWLTMPQYSNGKQHFPLLFDKNYKAKPAFWGIVDPSKLEPLVQNVNAYYSKEDNWDIAPCVSFGEGKTKANVKFLWEDGKVKLLVKVMDSTKDNDDFFNIYLDLNNDKSDEFSADDKTITIKRSDCKEVEGGYEKIYTIDTDKTKMNSKIGIDFKVNNNGDIASWSNLRNDQEKTTKYYGQVTFKPYSIVSQGKADIDGDIDEIWENQPEFKLYYTANAPKSDAIFKAMWDKDTLYVLANVTDDDLNSDSANAYEQDSVEVFIDQNNGKTKSYEDDDCQYRVNYKNEPSFAGVNCKKENLTSAVKLTKTGYVVEMAIKLTNTTLSEDKLLGLDFQVNDADKTGVRIGTRNWFDNTGIGYMNTGVFGTVKLVAAANEEKPAPNPNPQGGSTEQPGGNSTDLPDTGARYPVGYLYMLAMLMIAVGAYGIKVKKNNK